MKIMNNFLKFLLRSQIYRVLLILKKVIRVLINSVLKYLFLFTETMKVLAVFSLILAVAASYPIVETLTLSELSNAANSNANPELQPYFESAIDQIMENLFSGRDVCEIFVIFYKFFS